MFETVRVSWMLHEDMDMLSGFDINSFSSIVYFCSYCDCFAAGSFCSDACACLECCNKVEHEETIRETRQQIESRNPLAFAPKVILRVSDPPKASGVRTCYASLCIIPFAVNIT